MFGAVEQESIHTESMDVNMTRPRSITDAPSADQSQLIRRVTQTASGTLIEPAGELRDRLRYESESVCRSILGVSDEASWEEISNAHSRLVADMTPGPKADHQRVTLALAMLDEVNLAFASLQRQAVA